MKSITLWTGQCEVPGRPRTAQWSAAAGGINVYYEPGRISDVYVASEFIDPPGERWRWLATTQTPHFQINSSPLTIGGTTLNAVAHTPASTYHIYWRQRSDRTG